MFYAARRFSFLRRSCMKTLSRIALGMIVAVVFLGVPVELAAAGCVDPFTPLEVGTQGALRAAGLLIYGESGLTPDQYATATEFTSAEVFATVVNFVAVDRTKLSVVGNLIHARIDYDGKRPEAFQDILQENDLAPIEAAIKTLDGVSGRFAKSRKYLSPLIADLKREVERFRQGQGKLKGRWYATRQAALDERNRPLRVAAAEREKEAAQAKAQADQMEAAEKKRAAEMAAAVAAEKAKVQAFQTRVTRVLDKLLADPSWKGRVEDLSKIIPVAKELKRELEQAADDGKSLRAELQFPEAQRLCEKAVPSLEAALAWSRAAQSFAIAEAPQGAAVIREFLARYSAASSPELGPIWDPLLTFFRFCQVQEEGAASHLRKAKELNAAGKNAQAIIEYQTANTVFPNHQLAPVIEKLRKDSLGL